ncbi:glycosyl hydrolase [Niveibacterium sp. SC-1]|uniref:glycosyl hydrolase n=1 Tax=Niveibacterium sp. SC-1 TaxID=3135646 RepID=UPI00311F383E
MSRNKLAAMAILAVCTTGLEAAPVKIGLGQYDTEMALNIERQPPALRYDAGPAPTNQWYSSPLTEKWPHPLYAQPASYRPTPEGFQVDMPRAAPLFIGTREENDIVAPHRVVLWVQPTAFTPEASRLGRRSDWAIDVVMAAGAERMTATIAHGSPFSYYELTRGGVRVATGEPYRVFSRSADGRTLGIAVADRAYALFAPTGTRWREHDDKTLALDLPSGKGYFSIAVLPAPEPAQLRLLQPYAFAFITDTRVSWQYDEKRSQVTTRYEATTRPREGTETSTVFALYPHQWHDNPALPALLPLSYPSIRGELKLARGQGFETRYRYRGFVPAWPGLAKGEARERLATFLAEDLKAGADVLLGNRGTYWEGKGLNRAAQVMGIAEGQGDTASRDALLAALKGRLQRWFAPGEETRRYFHYSKRAGTLIGYPDEYGSAAELNDHHFHYGYWIFAAAQVALRDPEWARRENWGGMVELLIADIANTDPSDPMFPRLRHFDPYEGHSWASGTAPFYDGNNQESSSEAINAWAGMILWGEATGNTRLRDTGIYLYTTEIEALKHYWFDLHRKVFAAEYGNVDAAMVWGDKYVHTTWWTEDPREVHGINLLPLTTASLYLGTDPDYVARKLEAMDGEFARFIARGGKAPGDIWQDVLFGFKALDDANLAMTHWDPEGAVEEGETRSHTWHWMASLAQMGRPDFDVAADTPLYSVFLRSDGTRTYLAYNAGTRTRVVRFSDGMRLTVAPRSLGQARRKKP